MKYFRFNGKNDLWLGKYGKLERTLIPNELLTQKEVDKIKTDCPRLNIDKVFTVLDLSPNDTYISFGARFQDGTDHNTKFESKKYDKKLSIRESNEPIWQTKHSIWLGYLDEIQQGLEDLGETFPDLEKKLKSARWLRNGNEIHIPRGTQFTIEVDDVYENSWEYSVIRVHNGLMTGLPIILYDEASEKFKDRHCKLISESVGTLCNF